MVKSFVIMVYILALAVWAEGSIEDKIDNFVDRASSSVECNLGHNDACLRSFFLENQTAILVGSGVALLILIGCCVCCCRCCGREKRGGVVYLQMPHPAPASNNYRV